VTPRRQRNSQPATPVQPTMRSWSRADFARLGRGLRCRPSAIEPHSRHEGPGKNQDERLSK
jgi:hypothetical protein